MTIKQITAAISSKYPKDQIYSLIDELIPEYLDDNWKDEFNNIFEAYLETGRGEAESDILHSVIREHLAETNSELSTDDFCKLFDSLKELWQI